MCKKETRMFVYGALFFSTISLHGEIMLGQLVGIENNSKIRLRDNNIPVVCEPFGIKTFEWLVRDAKNPAECQQSIETFYRSHPHTRVYAHEHLRTYQTYHYEKIRNGCILYANGPESYSEMLLNEGLAIVDERVDNKEWNAKLKRAQIRGKNRKEALYESDILAKCSEKKR